MCRAGGGGGGASRRAFTLTTLRTTRARGAAVETRAGVAPQKASTPQRIQTKSAQDSTKPCGILGAMVRGAAQREARSRVCGVGSRATTGRRLLTTNSSHVLTTNHLSSCKLHQACRYVMRPKSAPSHRNLTVFVGHCLVFRFTSSLEPSSLPFFSALLLLLHRLCSLAV